MMRALVRHFSEAKKLVEPNGFLHLGGMQLDVAELHPGRFCNEVAQRLSSAAARRPVGARGRAAECEPLARPRASTLWVPARCSDLLGGAGFGTRFHSMWHERLLASAVTCGMAALDDMQHEVDSSFNAITVGRLRSSDTVCSVMVLAQSGQQEIPGTGSNEQEQHTHDTGALWSSVAPAPRDQALAPSPSFAKRYYSTWNKQAQEATQPNGQYECCCKDSFHD